MRKTLRKSKANVWVINLPNKLTPWDSSERRTTLEELLKDYEEGWFPRRERFLKPVSKAKPLFKKLVEPD